MLLTSLIFFCGLMLATRFSVVVLVPAIPGALALAVIVGIWSSASASLLLLMMGLAVVALQMGYVGGIGLQWGLRSMRRVRPQRWSGEPVVRT